MLVLSRKVGESIVIGDDVTIWVVDIRGDKVRIGVDAPREVPVTRSELGELNQKAASGWSRPDLEDLAGRLKR